MIALYRKELRSLLPMLALSTFLVSGDLISRPITERLDEDTFSDVAGLAAGEGTFLGFILWILAFMVAYASLPREHDEGTIEFLYALPITRRSIFFGKALAGLTVLWVTSAIGQITNYLLVSWNPSTFEGHQFDLRLAATAVLLHGLVATAAYAHGLFASFFRRFGLLPYAFLGYGVAVISEIEPSLGWINPLRVSRFEYVGSTLVVPWALALGHLAVSGVVGLVAYALWMGSFERLRDAFAKRSLALSVGFGCATAFAAFVGFLVSGFLVFREYGDNPPQDPTVAREAEGVTFNTSEARTEHYVFVYPENFHAQAFELITRADRVLEAASASYGARAIPSITVDVAEVSGHHEGIAAGARIRMGLVDQESWRLVHVLAHESTHVLQSQESEMHLADHGATTRFFIEGTAEWNAFEVCTGPSTVMTPAELVNETELRASSRVVATASWERHHIRLEDTFDNARFVARWDTALAYPLGETFGEAISRACGDDAVGDLARAFARPNAPQDATGEVLYRDALASIGCDLESVGTAWDTLLIETAATERARIDAIPRMSGGVVSITDESIVVEGTLDRAPLSYERYGLRLRADDQTPDTEVRSVPGVIVEGSSPRRVRFDVPRSSVSGPRFEMLFSIVVDERAFPFSEAWQGASAI
jgi:ABC-type transport system involved in multi-copper enzyme maturation permease subunit